MKVRVFRYIETLDGFDVTREYLDIAEHLGLIEWSPVVWIGRLFTMDNDVGEHWFDNWDLRAAKTLPAAAMGLQVEQLFFIDADRFADGRDGPCHSPVDAQGFLDRRAALTRAEYRRARP